MHKTAGQWAIAARFFAPETQGPHGRNKAPTVTLEAAAGWAGKGGAAKVANAPLTFFLMGVHFATPLKGWIVTERTHILYTEDGGETWTVQFTGADIILQNISFCDEKTGWAVGEYGYIYHTGDGGMSWEQQAGFFDISEETGDIVGGSYLFGVFAVDPKTAWAVGIDGDVVKTMDGGNTWEPVEKGIPKTHLFGVVANRNGSVVIAGRSSLLVSTDGGNSFKLASARPSIAYGWLFGLGPRGEGGLWRWERASGCIYPTRTRGNGRWPAASKGEHIRCLKIIRNTIDFVRLWFDAGSGCWQLSWWWWRSSPWEPAISKPR